MKQIFTFFCAFAIGVNLTAQVAPPQAFSYSGVARDAQSNPIATQTIGVQLSIIKTSPTGTAVYVENHFTNTDALGLFNLTVGTGAVQSGTFATIDWGNDSYYLKVGMDASGGTNFVVMGTTQLLSVPYALYAKSAGSASGGASKPVVVTNPLNPFDVFGSQANLSGMVTSDGGELVLAKGICYDTVSNPTTSKKIMNLGVGGDSISCFLWGLPPNTVFYARAFATNSVGTSYGNQITFQTDSCAINSILGTYIGTLTCTGSSANISVTISSFFPTDCLVHIVDLDNAGGTLVAHVSGLGYVTIPSQTVGSNAISGTGQQSGNSISVTYTITSGGVTDTCTYNGTK